MAEIPFPKDDAPTSEWVAYGELRTAAVLQEELAGYFDLTGDVVDAAGPLVECISDHPGPRAAIHVGALILARIMSDLGACVQLLRSGYAAQAISLVGTMLELSHVLTYIGNDETRAAEWMAWDKPTKSYPGPLIETINANSATFGADDATARREYEEIYRHICQVKHGNTLAIHLPNTAVFENLECIVIGPLVTESVVRLGHAAALWATRYAILAEVAFTRFHVPCDRAAEMLAQQSELATRHEVLAKASIQRFPNKQV